jgi:hypothetical protein
MAFDWEGLLGEDGYNHVCEHGLDWFGDDGCFEPYPSSYYDEDDSDN